MTIVVAVVVVALIAIKDYLCSSTTAMHSIASNFARM